MFYYIMKFFIFLPDSYEFKFYSSYWSENMNSSYSKKFLNRKLYELWKSRWVIKFTWKSRIFKTWSSILKISDDFTTLWAICSEIVEECKAYISSYFEAIWIQVKPIKWISLFYKTFLISLSPPNMPIL